MSIRHPTYGFTLIETMVAVTILTLSIAGPMTAANRAIVAAETARDQLSASYLAQEGIEYVRASRDDYFLASYSASTGSEWTNFLNGSLLPCRSPAVCNLGPLQTGGNLALCQTSIGACAPFSLVTGGGTKFTRTVQIKNAPCSTVGTESDGSSDVCIISKVTWSFHGTPYTVNITDHLSPWQ